MKRGEFFAHKVGVIRFEKTEGADSLFVVARTADTVFPCTLRMSAVRAARLKPLTAKAAALEIAVEEKTAHLVTAPSGYRERARRTVRARLTAERASGAANAA